MLIPAYLSPPCADGGTGLASLVIIVIKHPRLTFTCWDERGCNPTKVKYCDWIRKVV